MNEKYGIELELIMQNFNQKINKVKSAFKGIENTNIHVDYNGAELESVIIKMKELIKIKPKQKKIDLTHTAQRKLS